MASMAAAIAAARTAVMSNRPLDERERNRFAYFSSLNPMAKKIMQDKERIRERYGADWEKMPPREQEDVIDKSMMDPQLRTRYTLHSGAAEPQPDSCNPVVRAQTGQKVVHFGEEDLTWQDEHSAPFSWETRINNNHVVPGWFLHFPVLVHWPEQPCTVSSDTPYLWSAGGGRLLFCSIPMMKSQMEFSVASVGTQESASGPAQTEQKQTPKPVSQSNQTIKTPHGNQPAKAAQGSKTSSGDGPPPVRKEEESTFWKISMERSRIEGSQSEFQSLTPSQIKSLEKGEKPIPTYHRQESFQKEKDAVKPEKPNVVTKQPKTINPSMASGAMDLDRPRPSQSSVSTLDDVSLPEPAAPVPSVAAKAIREKEHKEEALSAEPQRFSQINTSSVLLKTGFDFLDNW